MANVTGPASSTDTAIARWNGTSGTAIEDSVVTVDSSGNMSGNAASASEVFVTSTASNVDYLVTMSGTADANAAQFANGNLRFNPATQILFTPKLAIGVNGGTITDVMQLSGALVAITNVVDPTNAQDAATKSYVDTTVSAIVAGLDSRPSCRVATTAALTATYSNGSSGVGATLTNSGTQAAISIDGVSLAANDRVLVKNQATAAQNGIYTVTTVGSGATNWVLTRATDFNSASGTGVVEGAFTVIEEGTSNFGTLWIETGAGPFTIGTTAITFTQLQVTDVTDAAILFSDITTNNSSTSKHGFLKKLDNTATHYMDGTGAWSAPAGTGVKTVSLQVFTASGTYTPSAGMVYCIAESIGGGGAGGGTNGTATGAAGGGGAGGYSRARLTAAQIGASKTITIGAGGTSGTAGFHPGNAGGDSSVGTLCIGKGGSGGAGGAGSSGAAGAGGVAGTGDYTPAGQSGTVGANTLGLGGAGGSSPFGGGAPFNYQTGGSTAGAAGVANTGGGGAGAADFTGAGTAAGGPGGSGIVIITEYST
jgi:hypothetical protein